MSMLVNNEHMQGPNKHELVQKIPRSIKLARKLARKNTYPEDTRHVRVIRFFSQSIRQKVVHHAAMVREQQYFVQCDGTKDSLS